MKSINKLVGKNGSVAISDTSEHPKLNAFMIIVQEDTVFAALEVKKIDAMEAQGATGYTYRLGAILTGANGNFTKITLTSGAVIFYIDE